MVSAIALYCHGRHGSHHAPCYICSARESFEMHDCRTDAVRFCRATRSGKVAPRSTIPETRATDVRTQRRRARGRGRRRAHRQRALPPRARDRAPRGAGLFIKDWIELFIRNEKILSPNSESNCNSSRNFHNFLNCQFVYNAQRSSTFSHTSVKFREIFIKF